MTYRKKKQRGGLTRQERMRLFIEAKPHDPAVQLAVAAEAAGLPLSTAAAAGGLSRYSVYLWVAGDVAPRPPQVTIIRRLTSAIEAAVEDGALPLMEQATPEEKVALVRRYL